MPIRGLSLSQENFATVRSDRAQRLSLLRILEGKQILMTNSDTSSPSFFHRLANHFQSQRRIHRIGLIAALIVFAGLAFTGIAVNARSWFAVDRAHQETASSLQNPTKAEEKIGAEMITLTEKGFQPSEITRPEGPFSLFIHSRAGVRGLNLEVNELQPGKPKNKIKDKVMDKNTPYTGELYDLKPGDYELTETSLPNYSCRIKITKKQNQ